MRNISEIVDIVRELKDLKSDGEVAETLNMSRTALSNHKSRGSVPFEYIVTFCENEGISIDWLLTGKGEKYRDDPELMTIIDELLVMPDIKKELFIRIVHKKPLIETVDPKIAPLIEKLSYIYKEGDRRDRAEVRGLIDEIYDELEIKKLTEKKEKDVA